MPSLIKAIFFQRYAFPSVFLYIQLLFALGETIIPADFDPDKDLIMLFRNGVQIIRNNVFADLLHIDLTLSRFKVPNKCFGRRIYTQT